MERGESGFSGLAVNAARGGGGAMEAIEGCARLGNFVVAGVGQRMLGGGRFCGLLTWYMLQLSIREAGGYPGVCGWVSGSSEGYPGGMWLDILWDRGSVVVAVLAKGWILAVADSECAASVASPKE